MENLLNLKCDWLHGKTVRDSPQTLYQLATVKITIALLYEDFVDFTAIERKIKKVYEKLLLMKLPKRIGNNFGQTIELIGDQLFKFRRLLPDLFPIQNCCWLRDIICWTSQGTIDKIRTAEELIETSELDVETKFQIAILFRLEDQINKFTTKLPHNFLEKNKKWLLNIAGIDRSSIAKYFDFGLSETFPDSLECFQKMLEKSNEIGCYFNWKLLSEEEKLYVMTPDFIDGLYIHVDNDSNYMLFLFTQCNKEQKLQLLQNEEYLYILMQQFLGLQWLAVFDVCLIDALNFMTVHSVLKLFYKTTKKVSSTIVDKKTYLEKCETILQFLSKDCSITTLSSASNNLIMNALWVLLQEGEINLVKNFLKSIENVWLAEWFSVCSYDLIYLIMEFFKFGMIEFLMTTAFPTAETKKEFLKKNVIDEIIIRLIIQWEHLDDIDKFLLLLFPNSKAMKRLKAKLGGERVCYICYRFLLEGKAKKADAFIQWCFTTEEEIIHFCNIFLRSRAFASLFSPHYLNTSNKAVISFIKANNALGRLANPNDLILDACQIIVVKYCYEYMERKESKTLFQVLDLFLLAFLQDDQKALINLKKELFTDTSRKFCISVPLEILRNNKSQPWYSKEKDELQNQMLDDFLNWICSSDDELKAKMEENFWNSEEIKEAKKTLKQKEIK